MPYQTQKQEVICLFQNVWYEELEPADAYDLKIHAVVCLAPRVSKAERAENSAARQNVLVISHCRQHKWSHHTVSETSVHHYAAFAILWEESELLRAGKRGMLSDALLGLGNKPLLVGRPGNRGMSLVGAMSPQRLHFFFQVLGGLVLPSLLKPLKRSSSRLTHTHTIKPFSTFWSLLT
jgi:hypothetical protein